MSVDHCENCGRAVWQCEEFCSGCGIAKASTGPLSDLFSQISQGAKRKCPRCGRNCRCVSVLFLYDWPQAGEIGGREVVGL